MIPCIEHNLFEVLALNDIEFYTPQSPVTVVEIVRSCAHAFINRACFLNTLPEDFLDPIMLFSWGVRSSQTQ